MSNPPARAMPRLYSALVAAVVGGTMAIILASAAVSIHRDPVGAGVLMLAGMWIPQQLITAGRYRRP